VQLIVTLILITPAWRLLWRLFPKLNDWIYPDLNGEWDVQGETNWNRIDALLKAAKGDGPPLDMRLGDEATLPPLGNFGNESAYNAVVAANKHGTLEPEWEGPN
jgi:hypothetical protein